MIKEKQETIKIKICDLCGEEIDNIMDGYDGMPAILGDYGEAKFDIHYKCLDDLILKHLCQKKKKNLVGS